MGKYQRRCDLFIDKVIDLCREYGFCLRPSDPYETIDVVSFSEDELCYLLSNKVSDLPF